MNPVERILGKCRYCGTKLNHDWLCTKKECFEKAEIEKMGLQ